MADQISHANLFTYVSVVTGMIYADTGIEDHYSVKNHIVTLRHTKNTVFFLSSSSTKNSNEGNADHSFFTLFVQYWPARNHMVIPWRYQSLAKCHFKQWSFHMIRCSQQSLERSFVRDHVTEGITIFKLCHTNTCELGRQQTQVWCSYITCYYLQQWQ